MPGNVFSEREASEILQQAARLQEQSGASEYTPGVTYEELVRIATEAGIDKDYLQKAIDSPPATAPKHSLFNLIEEQDKVLDGELDDDGLSELMDQIRDLVKLQRAQTFGKSIEAQAWRGGVCGTLKVSSKRGRTRIAFRQVPLLAYFTGLHVPLVLSIPLAIGLGSHGGAIPAILGPLALLTAGGSVFYMVAQAGKRKARELFAKIVGLAQGELARAEPKPTE
ncbi:MAG: hypothetical protein JSS66_17345 [Armatimonadetes bacterium]|nr:hypothetical protein [Armatimonadota bacterium]